MEHDVKILIELLENKRYLELRNRLAEMNEVNIALFLATLSSERAALAFRTLPKGLAAEVFANLEPDMQKFIIESITDYEIGVIIEDLYIDDAVDMLEEMPAGIVKRVLKNAQPETRNLINQFLQYPEDSAGSIMTAEFTDLDKCMSVGEAIDRIRKTGADSETIYTCYVIDDNRVLEGVVSVKDLLLAEDGVLVEHLMETDIVLAKTHDDREAVARQFSLYGLISIPVVDHEGRLVGIVTIDDAVEVIEQEATEDFEKMAAILPSERPYLKTSVLEMSKNRIPWLLFLMVSGMITGVILGGYEEAFAAFPLLVTFIPMLTDTGGNSGSQASTLVIRGMAVGEITSRDALTILWKETRISLLVGFILSAVNFLRLIITYPGQIMMALTVALALYAAVVVAKTVGCMLPMLAKAIKLDPALTAAPLITTIVDAVALIIYFNLAHVFLRV
jgi:magnesium transporter